MDEHTTIGACKNKVVAPQPSSKAGGGGTENKRLLNNTLHTLSLYQTSLSTPNTRAS
jgi:hypothetical protein